MICLDQEPVTDIVKHTVAVIRDLADNRRKTFVIL